MILLPQNQCLSAAFAVSVVNQLISIQADNIQILILPHTTHKISIIDINSECERQNHNTVV